MGEKQSNTIRRLEGNKLHTLTKNQVFIGKKKPLFVFSKGCFSRRKLTPEKLMK
jgi:hypothetical protein